MFHPDPSHFIEDAKEFGALGKAIVGLANLEFAHDRYVMTVRDKHPDLAKSLSRQFPRHFTEKTNFLIESIIAIPALRRMPFLQSGELNLMAVQYGLDELYGLRSILAHGSVFQSFATDERITWQFDRYVSVKKAKNTWTVESFRASNGFLASVHWFSEVMKSYIYSLTRILEGRGDWEDFYQSDKEIRATRKMMAHLKGQGVDLTTSWGNPAELFPPLGPVE